METIERLKEILKQKDYIGKACPICGAAPNMVSVKLDVLDEHGVPGPVDLHLECGGCGIVKAGAYDTIHNTYNTAKIKAIQDWNEVVDYINDLITKSEAS